jgi:hypothetical protein
LRTLRFLVVLGILLMCGHAAAKSACVDKDGTTPIIESGREGDIFALFSPYTLGEELSGHPGITFADLPVQSTEFSAVVSLGKFRATLKLVPLECSPSAPAKSASFAFESGIPPSAPEALRKALEAMQAAVTANDDGSFWQARSIVATGGAQVTSNGKRHGGAGLTDTVTALILILLGALLFLAHDAKEWWSRMGFAEPDGKKTFAALLALTGMGALLRFGLDPTFIREAYALPSIAWLGESVDLKAAIDAYPQGPDLTVSTIGLWLSSDPFDAWFVVHQLLGTLTIFVAFGAGKELIGHKAGGLVTSALIAFWPQHIRLSASEVTHIHLIFWAFLAITWALIAARNGKLLSFHTLVWLSATMAIMRPEAPLMLLGIGLIALGHGPGVRTEYKSLRRWIFVAFVIWLLYPTFMTILDDKSIDNFTQDDHGESVGFDSVLSALGCFLIPDGRNAFFDPETSPLWLWPLCLWGAVVLWRRGSRWACLGLSSMVGIYMVLYSGLPYSVVIWKMSRYHATMLPAVVLLTGVGLWDVLGRIRWTKSSLQRRVGGGIAIAALGCILWSPALVALPMDWQQDIKGSIDLGREHQELWGPKIRVVTPDNRRRFLDLSPRTYISALTRGRQEPRMAIPVAYAARYLRTDEEWTETYFYGGLYCYLAVLPDEQINPQCRAMEKIFEMTEVGSVTIDTPPYLVAYKDTRIKGTLKLPLYKIGKRKLSPDEAMKLIPEALGTDSVDLVPGYPIGSATSPFSDPPKPGIGSSIAPAFKQVPW